MVDATFPIMRKILSALFIQTMTAAALDTYIMSACPDAEYAISQLLSPAIAGTQHVTECAFHMIGQLDDSCELGVRCMHGERECQGNAYILRCVKLRVSEVKT